MANYRNWRGATEFVGMLAVVGSLIFVGLQMQQTNDVAYMELDSAMVAITVDTADLVAANPEIWVAGNAGEELSRAESAVYYEMISVINTRWVVAESHAGRLGRADIADLIRRDWAAFLHQNPGAREVWQSREDNLIEYRQLLAPDEQDFSGWRDAIQSDLAVLDAAAR